MDKPSKKRPIAHTSSVASSSKKTKMDKGQATLGSFFQKSTHKSKTAEHAHEVIDIDDDEVLPPESIASAKSMSEISSSDQDQVDADYRLACELAASEESTSGLSSTPPSGPSSQNAKAVWTTLFTPTQAPNCTVHGEPAKKFTVNKPGPNKGRTFYVCSR